MRKFQQDSKDRLLNQEGLIRLPSAQVKPIEDIQIYDALAMTQLTPIDIKFSAQEVEDYAYKGMSLRAIAGMLGTSVLEVKTHFTKTINKGRGRRSLELLDELHERPKDWMPLFKMLDRIDPMEDVESEVMVTPEQQLLKKFVDAVQFEDNSKQKLTDAIKATMRKV